MIVRVQHSGCACAAWTDCSNGQKCAAADSASWTVILTGSVDGDGWEYAGSFGDFEADPVRQGGRGQCVCLNEGAAVSVRVDRGGCVHQWAE